MSSDRFPIEQYYPFLSHQGANIKDIRKLHNLVVKFHGEYIGNEDLQAFLYPGYDEAPIHSDYTDVVGVEYISHPIKASLKYLEMLLLPIQTPQFFIDEAPSFEIFPAVVGSLEEAIDELSIQQRKNSNGITEEQVRQLQDIWYGHLNSEERKKVLDFRTALWNCASQFDLKFILNGIQHKARGGLTLSPYFADDEWSIFVTQVNDVFEPNSYGALDSAYYTRGKVLMHPVAKLYEEILQDEQSPVSLFAIPPQELEKAQKMI